jgi:hypothetical protein
MQIKMILPGWVVGCGPVRPHAQVVASSRTGDMAKAKWQAAGVNGAEGRFTAEIC